MRVLLLLLFFLSPLVLFGEANTLKQVQVESLDQQINELKEQKNGLLSRAYRLDMNADRWQFDGRLTDARRAWQSAEENRKQADEIQQKINQLEQRKKEILEAK